MNALPWNAEDVLLRRVESQKLLREVGATFEVHQWSDNVVMAVRGVKVSLSKSDVYRIADEVYGATLAITEGLQRSKVVSMLGGSLRKFMLGVKTLDEKERELLAEPCGTRQSDTEEANGEPKWQPEAHKEDKEEHENTEDIEGDEGDLRGQLESTTKKAKKRKKNDKRRRRKRSTELRRILLQWRANKQPTEVDTVRKDSKLICGSSEVVVEEEIDEKVENGDGVSTPAVESEVLSCDESGGKQEEVKGYDVFDVLMQEAEEEASYGAWGVQFEAKCEVKYSGKLKENGNVAKEINPLWGPADEQQNEDNDDESTILTVA